jgi:hypothetical protein
MRLLRRIKHMFMEYGVEVRKSPRADFSALPVFQICVAKVMKDFGSSLRFIQVGANDGIYGDPIRDFIIKYQWSGILVEPQLDVFECLKQNYAACESNLIFANVAVSGNSEFLTIYRAPQVEASGSKWKWCRDSAWNVL